MTLAVNGWKGVERGRRRREERGCECLVCLWGVYIFGRRPRRRMAASSVMMIGSGGAEGEEGIWQRHTTIA